MLYYVITHLFCTLGYNPILIYLFLHFSSFIYWELFQVVILFLWHIPVTMFLFFHNTSLAPALQNAAGSSCIFPAPDLESDSFFPGDLILCWIIVLETKIWVLGVLLASGMSLLLDSFSWQIKNMHTNSYISMSMNISICNHLHLY